MCECFGLTKAQSMKALADKIRICEQCPLWEKRKKAVPGDGDVNASVVFVGEAPGRWEDIRGRPFVGAAGKVLDALFGEIGLGRESVFITNVVKCRPSENREPRPLEVATCTSLYLDHQIRLIEPRIIATLGRHSTIYVLSKAGFENVDSISGFRGRIYPIEFLGLPVAVVPMYHPASVLHNPRYMDDLEDDFQLLKSEIKKQKIR